MGTVYCAFHTHSKALYIGLTTRSLEVRRQEHINVANRMEPTSMFHSVLRFCPDQWIWFEMYHSDDPTKLSDIEILLIASLKEDCVLLNDSIGGPGGRLGSTQSEETRQKISDSLIGVPKSQEAIKNMTKPKTQKHALHIRQAQMMNPNHHIEQYGNKFRVRFRKEGIQKSGFDSFEDAADWRDVKVEDLGLD